MSDSLITIPEYFMRFINSTTDLTKTPKIQCPFHSEDTPSFSYSQEKGIWRCFGACHDGGDVIALHRRNYKLRTRLEAENSLYKLLGLRHTEAPHRVESGIVDEFKAKRKVAYAEAILLAKTVDDWLELDYIVGQYPIDLNKLIAFADCRRSSYDESAN